MRIVTNPHGQPISETTTLRDCRRQLANFGSAGVPTQALCIYASVQMPCALHSPSCVYVASLLYVHSLVPQLLVGFEAHHGALITMLLVP